MPQGPSWPWHCGISQGCKCAGATRVGGGGGDGAITRQGGVAALLLQKGAASEGSLPPGSPTDPGTLCIKSRPAKDAAVLSACDLSAVSDRTDTGRGDTPREATPFEWGASTHKEWSVRGCEASHPLQLGGSWGSPPSLPPSSRASSPRFPTPGPRVRPDHQPGGPEPFPAITNPWGSPCGGDAGALRKCQEATRPGEGAGRAQGGQSCAHGLPPAPPLQRSARSAATRASWRST